jgi:branched-chain amino acid transport system permease protein
VSVDAGTSPAVVQAAAAAGPARPVPLLLGLAALVGLPALAGHEAYFLFNASLALVSLLLATGYNFLLGMAGQLALSHVAFFAIGAYTSALLTRDAGLPFPVALAAAIALPSLSAWAIAGAAVRFVGPYLAMVTFAFHAMVQTLCVNWIAVTNGWGGLSRIPPVRLGTLLINTPTRSYYLLLGAATVGLYVAYRVKYSRLGRALFAIRENRMAARNAGIDTRRTITVAFCLSGAFAGLAGSLLAHLVRYIDPTSFGFQSLIDLLVILIVGGRGNILGVSLAAAGFVFALEYLRFLQDWKLMIFGLLLIVLINVSPDGIGGLFRWRLRRTGAAPA